MAKRQFSPERLWKVLRFLVIVISILSGVLAFWNYIEYKHYDGEKNRLYKVLHPDTGISTHRYHLLKNKEKEGTVTENEKQLIKDYEKTYGGIDVDDVRRRIDDSRFLSSEKRKGFILFFCILIFLPLIFFGGTWFYRYLFPIKREG